MKIARRGCNRSARRVQLDDHIRHGRLPQQQQHDRATGARLVSWIKVRTDLAADPAVVSIAAALGVDRFAVVGRLHWIWSWAGSNSRDGRIAGVTAAWIDELVALEGFAAAMISAGWLIESDRGIRFPKFNRHNGQSAKTRALTAQRVARSRSRSGNDRSVTQSLPEKRREEKREGKREDHDAPQERRIADSPLDRSVF